MGLLSSGQAMLGRVMKGEGQEVIYKRGHRSIDITVNPDAPQEPKKDSDGYSVSFGERDFAMDLADLGVLGTPEEGDLIQWESVGVTYVYKVLPTDTSKCWDWLDNHHLRLVARTKLLHAN